MPAVGQVNGAQSSVNTGASFALAFTGAITAGSTILAAVSPAGGSGVTWNSVTDNVNAGNYIPVSGSYLSSASMEWFYYPNSLGAAAGALSVTATAGSNAFITLLIHEATGLGLSPTLEDSNAGTGASPFGVNVTTAHANALVLGFLSASAPVKGASFTAGASAVSATFITEWLAQASPGTVSVNGTSSGSVWDSAMALVGVQTLESAHDFAPSRFGPF